MIIHSGGIKLLLISVRFAGVNQLQESSFFYQLKLKFYSLHFANIWI